MNLNQAIKLDTNLDISDPKTVKTDNFNKNEQLPNNDHKGGAKNDNCVQTVRDASKFFSEPVLTAQIVDDHAKLFSPKEDDKSILPDQQKVNVDKAQVLQVEPLEKSLARFCNTDIGSYIAELIDIIKNDDNKAFQALKNKSKFKSTSDFLKVKDEYKDGHCYTNYF